MSRVKESPRVKKFIEKVKRRIKADPEYKPLVSHIPGLADPLLYHPLYPPGFNTREEGVERMRWTKAVRRDSKIRLFAFKELFGGIIEDLTLDEWATWTRFKLLMSACPFKPMLKLNESDGMDDESIAELIRVPIETWLVTKKKLITMKRIKVVSKSENIIWIPSWSTTQEPRELPVSYLKTLTDKMLEAGEGNVKLDDDELEEAAFIKAVIEHLNNASKKHFTLRSVAANRHINARRKEGATLENFKHVIDVKCYQWLGTQMEIFVRPMTLFNSEKFWGYANEPMPKKKESVYEDHSWDEFTKEERSFLPYLRREYNILLNKTLQLKGVERFEELPNDFPTQDTWIKTQLRERRKRLEEERAKDKEGSDE